MSNPKRKYANGPLSAEAALPKREGTLYESPPLNIYFKTLDGPLDVFLETDSEPRFICRCEDTDEGHQWADRIISCLRSRDMM